MDVMTTTPQTPAAPNLTASDAAARARLISVDSYRVELDLTAAADHGDGTFGSTTTVTFRASRPGAATVIDLVAHRLDSAVLNGRPLAVAGYDPAAGIPLTDLASENTITVSARMCYSSTGEGLHRFVDPGDGETYLWTQFESAEAKRAFACFDQPDLKAEITLSVRHPTGWQTISNAPQAKTTPAPDSQLVEFAPTPRISTYLFAVVAGPYDVVRARYRDIELGLWLRRSLLPDLDAAELFELTRQGLAWCETAFAQPYPFAKYDQVFVPDFNAGAMENVGCVTLKEDFILRATATGAERERRGEIILHEIAHMWFGNLVTMTWWDDLWLNESFATYISVLAQADTALWPDAWTTFVHLKKDWAYEQDQMSSTHPVAGAAPDVMTAEANFDGITYAKGAAVLKQLAAKLGGDTYLRGVQQYLTSHAYRNATLTDLLSAFERASNLQLHAWADAWLRTGGVNTLTADTTVGLDGHYTSFDIVQTAPSDIVATNVLRPHRVAIGLYDDDDHGRLTRVGRVEIDVAPAGRTAVPELIGRSQAALALVNDDDLSYCKTRPDATSLRTLLEGGAARLDQSLARAQAWSLLWDLVRDGELAARSFLGRVHADAVTETDVGTLRALIDRSLYALEFYSEPGSAAEGYALLADVAWTAIHIVPAGSDAQLVWARGFLRSARTARQADGARQIAESARVPTGLRVDDDLRWSALQSLVALGAADSADIESARRRDTSPSAERNAATARALLPDAASKQRAWRMLTADPAVSVPVRRALIAGFAHPLHGELIAPYAAMYFDDVLGVWARHTSQPARLFAKEAYPFWHATITRDCVGHADALLARELPDTVRRFVTAGREQTLRAFRARTTDAAAGVSASLRALP
jgi:aminopeptidase N